jgi:hypothetical protein
MEFIISGQTIQIESLDSCIDDQFIMLHAAYFGSEVLKWDTFVTSANEFFDKFPDPKSGFHDKFFNNFTVIWRSYLQARNYDAAEHIWSKALSTAFLWESSNSGKRIHKGTPYYFWGMTALERGDLDKGYALMHQAVTEDTLTHGGLYPASPAFAFASLNYAEPAQAFREWLYKQMVYIDSFQNNYSSQYARPFKLDDFKNKFLLNPPTVDLGFLFAYTVARLMHLAGVPDHALTSSFAAQLEANLLFDLTLVIDGTIKTKNVGEWKFSKHASFLLNALGEPLTDNELGEVNQAFQADFDKTLATILDGTFTLSQPKSLSPAQRDVSLAYGLRNRGAHDVTAAPTVWTKFSEIQQSLFNVLYLSVDFLY